MDVHGSALQFSCQDEIGRSTNVLLLEFVGGGDSLLAREMDDAVVEGETGFYLSTSSVPLTVQ